MLSKHKRTDEERIEVALSRPVGARIAVAVRGNEDKALRDASVLAEFIGVPMRHVRRTVVADPRAVGAGHGGPGEGR